MIPFIRKKSHICLHSNCEITLKLSVVFILLKMPPLERKLTELVLLSSTSSTSASALSSHSSYDSPCSHPPAHLLHGHGQSNDFPTRNVNNNNRKSDDNASSNKKAGFGPTETSMPQIHIQFIPHFTELDEDARSQLWFTCHEMDQIMKEATQTIAAMNNSMFLHDDDPEFTIRGLEYMTSNGFDITTNSLETVRLVLEEQNRQRQAPDYVGRLDVEQIAESTRGISRHRLRIAHLAAMKDARTVYGQGNFKLDAQTISTGSKEDPQRGMSQARGSSEAVRRRRGSRGSLQRREARHSAPVDASIPMINGTEKLRNSCCC